MSSDGVQFSRRAVVRHLAKHHPFCPPEVVAAITDRVLGRRWCRASIGAAIGIVATNYIRHHLTDYERMLRIPGMTRAEARQIVQFEVRDILAGWSAPQDA